MVIQGVPIATICQGKYLKSSQPKILRIMVEMIILR